MNENINIPGLLIGLPIVTKLTGQEHDPRAILIWGKTNQVREELQTSMEKLEVASRDEWRAWLAANYTDKKEIWLVFNKKGTGVPSISYDAAVEEALCFGWIDSIIKRLDDAQFVRKFTPRTEKSNWSALNIKRAEKMIQSGLMTAHGLRLIEAAKANGKWEKPVQKPTLTYHLHPEFEEALRRNKTAKGTFDNLSPTYQQQYIGWIQIAKREKTRRKRIEESIRLLEQGKKLGLR
jgi:uncharacterized protein YdeI (YjbR/CyaY-like superfamily)